MNKENVTAKTIEEDVMSELEDELTAKEKVDKEMLNELSLKKSFFYNIVYKALFSRILKGLKIRIIVTWRDKEIFNYEIPKD